jgi:hypothetical protein
MRKLIFIFLFLAFLNLVTVQAADKPKVLPAQTLLMLDNFDDQNLELDPAWWHFDKVEFNFVPNEKANIAKLGAHYLKISGSTNDWYVGGMGTYLAIDVNEFSGLTVAINGFGPTSGRVKIELYDDDNASGQLEQDSSFQPLFDDKFQYELTVNWTGWQQITIPFSKFQDMNPAVGNNKWDGKLVHLQLVFITSKQQGAVNLGIDNLSLTQ